MPDAQFTYILSSLNSIDKNVKKQAKRNYNNLTRDVRVNLLIATLQNGQQSEEARQRAALLLRRLFTSEFRDFYNELPQEAKGQLLQQLLSAVQQDLTPNLRRKICDAVAEAVRSLIDGDGTNHWPDVLQFLLQCANSPSAQLQESALRIFASVPSVFGNEEALYLTLIKQMLTKTMEPASDAEVRFQAVRAMGAFLLRHNENDSVIFEQFVDLLPRMIMITAESIEAQADPALLKLMINVTECSPTFVSTQLELIFEICMQVFSAQDIEDSWRHLVLEVMVSLGENAPAMVTKRAEPYIIALTTLVLQMMTHMDDNDDWATSDTATENDNINMIAESSLNRLACGLASKALLPLVMHALHAMVGHADWKQRYASLRTISVIARGYHTQMAAWLEQVMAGVLNFLRDPHPRVRYAACSAIAQMSTDFAPTLEEKLHEQVVPGLLTLLDDVRNPRVQAHAGAALVKFSENCPQHILTRYLDGIMGKLVAVLISKCKESVEKGYRLVLEQVVTTIASVADTCEKELVVAYYDRLMPCLKFIIQNGNSEDLRMLRGMTIRCVSLIGLAVGRDKFIVDAGEVMDMCVKTHSEGDSSNDGAQTAYEINAWARICKVLGKQFKQYLPLVMGPVMRTAAMQTDDVLFDDDEVEDTEGDVDNLREMQDIAIMAGMDEKATACEMLVCYARELKEGFADYTEEVVRLMVPMLQFYLHDRVRTAAAESLPCLLDCAKIKGPQYVQGMWMFIFPQLVNAIATELDGEVPAKLLNSLAKCIETLGAKCLNDDEMEQVLAIIAKYMDWHFKHADKRLVARAAEHFDEDDEEESAVQNDTDTDLLPKIVGILHALFLTNKAQFLPHFDQIAHQFAKLLDPARSWSDRQWGLCAFADVIEFCGPASARYQQYFAPALLQYVSDKSPEVRQAAAYGCGVLGQFGGPQYAVTCAQFIPLLIQVVNDPKSRQPQNVYPTEKAISAVTKILKYNQSALQNVNEIINVWFAWLPVTEDSMESHHIYGYLCDLLQVNHHVILGADSCNLPRIVSIIAQAFETKIVAALTEVGSRMLGLVKEVESKPQIFEACASQLTPEMQHALQEACRELALASAQALKINDDQKEAFLNSCTKIPETKQK